MESISIFTMLVCFICSLHFDSLRLLQHHVNRHNLFGLRSYSCQQDGCMRSYPTLKAVYKHIRVEHLKKINEVSNTVSTSSVDILEANGVNTVHNINTSLAQENTSLHDADNVVLESPSKSLICPPCARTVEDSNLNDISYVLSFYNNPSLSRSEVVHIVNNTEMWADQRFGSETHNLSKLDTEYKIIKELTKRNLWIEPRTLVLDYFEGVRKENCSQAVTMTPFTCQVIPLKKIFVKIFSIPHVLELACQYMSNSNQLIGDVKDAQIGKNLSKNTFPFVLFFDEVETGNPLGSHKGIYKVGAFYISFRCFPTHMYSKLANIYPYLFLPSSAVDYVYMKKVLINLVEEIRCLENDGIEILGSMYYFKFIGLTGDNLGQHQVLGFTTSFSSNFPCRICKASKELCRSLCREQCSLLRNPLNYDNDVALNDVSKSGIKYNCPLNDLPNYHVTTNVIMDIMHDVLEGIANYGMCAVVSSLLSKRLIDSLDVLNDRIFTFPFGYIANRPPVITKKNLEREDLSFSASEMLNLVLYFNLIIGDLIPKDNEIWMYYLSLRDMLNILLFKEISLATIHYLDAIITEHHEMYISVFHQKLKPKHHHLLHYKRALLLTGPLCHNWAMRFESKNYQTKLMTQVIRSRINICKSLAIRHMFLFSSNLINLQQKEFRDIEKSGPSYTCEFGECYKWVIIKGCHYEREQIVRIISPFSDLSDDREAINNPQFVMISAIVWSKGGVLFLCEELNTICFNQHMACHCVTKREITSYECFSMNEISKPLLYTKSDVFYVANVGF